MLSWNELAQDPLAIAIAAGVVVLLIGAVVVALRRRRKRRDQLQRRFGAEYERTVREGRSRRQAEADLEVRRERRDQLELRVLKADERDLYRARFEELQASFVDAPETAVRSVDGLIDEVAEARGYREVDGISRMGLVSVDHPEQVAEHHRGLKQLSADARSGTEDLRQALLSARALLDRLVNEGEAEEADAPSPPRSLLGLDEEHDEGDEVDDRAEGVGGEAGDVGSGVGDVGPRSEHRTLGSRADRDGHVTGTVDLTTEEPTQGAR